MRLGQLRPTILPSQPCRMGSRRITPRRSPSTPLFQTPPAISSRSRPIHDMLRPFTAGSPGHRTVGGLRHSGPAPSVSPPSFPPPPSPPPPRSPTYPRPLPAPRPSPARPCRQGQASPVMSEKGSPRNDALSWALLSVPQQGGGTVPEVMPQQTKALRDPRGQDVTPAPGHVHRTFPVEGRATLASTFRALATTSFPFVRGGLSSLGCCRTRPFLSGRPEAAPRRLLRRPLGHSHQIVRPFVLLDESLLWPGVHGFLGRVPT